MIKPKVVLLIFVSGKIVLTGAKVTGHSLGASRLLRKLTFPSGCEGAGGDIHGVQHDLHRAMRVPQAVTTAWPVTPPRPHTGGGVKLCSARTFIERTWIPLDLSLNFSASAKNGCRVSLLKKKPAFQRPTCTCTLPLPPTCTYILANTILQNTYSWTFRPPVLVIALSIAVYSESFFLTPGG
jgi:Transcription factor TFIID (or TATA-binding protein, TBP)